MAKQQARQTIPENAPGIEGDESEQSGVTSPAGARGDAEEDHIYGLASVLYHALQGVTAARKYAEDARRAGADELREFFEECSSEADARAKQAKSLLVAYSEDDEDKADADAADGENDEAEDEDDEDEDDEDDDAEAQS